MNHNEKQKQVLQQLQEARTALLEVARDLDQEAWTQPVYAHTDEEEPGQEWTAVDLLRHLAWAESGMTRLIGQIQRGEEGVPEDFDLHRYNASGVRKLKEMVPSELLALMDKNRQQLLETIESLQPEDWDKEGRHGSLQMMSISQILQIIAAHEQQHLEDLRGTLSRPGIGDFP